MWTSYNDTAVHFHIGNTRIQALNFVYECFQRSIPSHAHGSDSFEIHYISQGRGHALIDGDTYQISPGTLYVTGPHVEHAQVPSPDDPMCEYCIYLKTEKRRRVHASADPSPSPENEVLSLFSATRFWFGQDSQQTGSLFTMLFQELAHKKTGYELQVEALLRQILVHLVRNYEKGSRSRASTASSETDKTSVIIEEYFLYQYATLSLEELSCKLGLGTRQTERLLQKYYGKTFLQKKAEARMSAAATLLSNTEQSITAIAEELGYSSAEHFSSAFRHFYHISPRQYRKAGVYHSFPLPEVSSEAAGSLPSVKAAALPSSEPSAPSVSGISLPSSPSGSGL